MNREDSDGRFLWNETENWNHGLPHSEISVEIGDDHSGQPLHCVIPSGIKAACMQFELAEHAGTQGTTLRLEEGASLTVHGRAVLSKDRESWFHVDGRLTCVGRQCGIQVGGPWGRPDLNEPAFGHLIIGPTGVVDSTYIGINTHTRANAPAYGETFNGTMGDSEIVVNGGRLVARQGLRMATTDPDRPGTVRLTGAASFTSEHDSEYGVGVYCGILEIEGGDVTIEIGDLRFQGDRFRDSANSKSGQAIGPGLSVLKLTGEGVSTIHARNVDFVNAAVMDVSDLTVAPGTYTVIDGATITGGQLELSAGTDTDRWSFAFDRDAGDLLLTFTAER